MKLQRSWGMQGSISNIPMHTPGKKELCSFSALTWLKRRYRRSKPQVQRSSNARYSTNPDLFLFPFYQFSHFGERAPPADLFTDPLFIFLDFQSPACNLVCTFRRNHHHATFISGNPVTRTNRLPTTLDFGVYLSKPLGFTSVRHDGPGKKRELHFPDIINITDGTINDYAGDSFFYTAQRCKLPPGGYMGYPVVINDDYFIVPCNINGFHGFCPVPAQRLDRNCPAHHFHPATDRDNARH